MSGQPGAAPLSRQFLYMLLSTLFTLAVAEATVRWADGGALPQLDCYRTEAGRLALDPGCARRLPSAGGGTWELRIGADGLREVPGRPAPGASSPAWLLAGDSQVLGMGVADGATTAAAAARLGLWVAPVGVPGHGLEEALAQAEARLEAEPASVAGVLAVVNAANDWSEAGRPALERYAVLGGWLISRQNSATVWGRFFATPLARSHFLVQAVSLAGRDWSEEPQARRLAESPWGMPPQIDATATGGRREAARLLSLALHSFAARHPEVPLRAVLLPVDFSTSGARARAVLRADLIGGLALPPWQDAAPWTELLGMIPDVQVIDLRDDLTEPSHFLDGDYHLSAAGHTVVAACLARNLQPAKPPP